ncbi:hypothetical protein M422DRAFT_48197 [Sphaerobolus stellatus SS14]|uniref:Uncharacterized protein n=1 Tax=Sphaerobolus stellatus (strain SS14) TaxID=990650 RepID=A0A0C9UHN5_SPHS4|nr:hypothetical protein M422DRAFT_48197 [Sphaerobolus stellatus SS14]
MAQDPDSCCCPHIGNRSSIPALYELILHLEPVVTRMELNIDEDDETMQQSDTRKNNALFIDNNRARYSMPLPEVTDNRLVLHSTAQNKRTSVPEFDSQEVLGNRGPGSGAAVCSLAHRLPSQLKYSQKIRVLETDYSDPLRLRLMEQEQRMLQLESEYQKRMTAALQEQNAIFQEQLRVMREGNVAVLNEFQGKHFMEMENMKREMERIKSVKDDNAASLYSKNVRAATLPPSTIHSRTAGLTMTSTTQPNTPSMPQPNS